MNVFLVGNALANINVITVKATIVLPLGFIEMLPGEFDIQHPGLCPNVSSAGAVSFLGGQKHSQV